MSNIPNSIPQQDQELIADLLSDKPFKFTELTQTQYEGFNQGVLDDGNHIVIAETGNGKTFLAEAVTKKALKNNETVAYLVPSTALVTDKYEKITQWAPDKTNIKKRNGYTQADIIVATFESFYEAVVRGYASRFDQIIFDDFHEIYSTSRGPNIEKGISAAIDQGSEIFAISATIGNPDTIAQWMNARLTISTENRAVPIKETPIEKTNQSYADQITDIIQDNPDRGPYLVFCDTTSNAEARARGIAEENSFEIDKDVNFKQDVQNNISTDLTDKHQTLIRLLKNGVGYHHGKLENGLKSLIEEYAETGIIKCVTCTTSLSYGFDSPVQSVVVADLKRWDGYRQFIGVFEYVQMVGRAGRNAQKYDEAYAFPLYDDEDAKERFQFDTQVEYKDLEPIKSHLSGDTTLRWLILELINYGWETKNEVVDFISSTLFWTENIETATTDKQLRENKDKIGREVDRTIEWLEDRDLITELPSGQTSFTQYRATELGDALVEYQHSNWFENSVQKVLNYTQWIKDQVEDDQLTPERFVERLAGMYYHCEESASFGNEKVYEQMSNYDLYDEQGETAALVCWYWCSGASIKDIASNLDVNDLSRLPSTASNITSALESTKKLFNPQEMPRQPQWFDKFIQQIETGVAGKDMHLVANTKGLGRARYNYLVDTLQQASHSWDPGEDHYVIERLSALLDNSDETQFKDTLKSANMVGDEIAERIYKTIANWEPEANTTTIPFENTITTQIERQMDETETPSKTTQSSPKQQPQNPSPENGTTNTAVDANENDLEYTSIDDFC